MNYWICLIRSSSLTLLFYSRGFFVLNTLMDIKDSVLEQSSENVYSFISLFHFFFRKNPKYFFYCTTQRTTHCTPLPRGWLGLWGGNTSSRFSWLTHARSPLGKHLFHYRRCLEYQLLAGKIFDKKVKKDCQRASPAPNYSFLFLIDSIFPHRRSPLILQEMFLLYSCCVYRATHWCVFPRYVFLGNF